MNFVSELPYGPPIPHWRKWTAVWSGGQRQRLAAARSFYRGFRVFLLLDEATRRADNRTESDVIEALDVIVAGAATTVVDRPPPLR